MYRIFQLLILLFILNLACCKRHQSSFEKYSQQASKEDIVEPPAGIKVYLQSDKPQYTIGEDMLFHLCVKNDSKETVETSLCAGFDGSLSAYNDKGEAAYYNSFFSFNRCNGQSGGGPLSPGKEFCYSISLQYYLKYLSAGTWKLIARTNFGLPGETQLLQTLFSSSKTERIKLSGAETSVRITNPSNDDVDKILSTIDALPKYCSSFTINERRNAMCPTLSHLYHPAYLSQLIKRAELGSVEAVYGIGYIPTFEAAQELVKLLEIPNDAVSHTALEALNQRYNAKQVDWYGGQSFDKVFANERDWFSPELLEKIRVIIRSKYFTHNKANDEESKRLLEQLNRWL